VTAAVTIVATSAPRLAPQIKLRFDETRQRWTLLAPERVLVPDEIAVEVLKLCDGIATVDAIADTLAAKFQAPRGEVIRDVQEMLQDLANKGMLVA
jgi:pyrroloquinoline quinone biosynthesis protein D